MNLVRKRTRFRTEAEPDSPEANQIREFLGRPLRFDVHESGSAETESGSVLEPEPGSLLNRVHEFLD
jgi:hypothetical protein